MIAELKRLLPLTIDLSAAVAAITSAVNVLEPYRVVPALRYALSLALNNVTAAYVDLNEETTAKLQAQWAQLFFNKRVAVLSAPYHLDK